MSDYHRIHCLDCDEEDYGSRTNWCHEGLVDAIKNRGLLIATQCIEGWVEIAVTVDGQLIDIKFLQTHMDHHLVSMSEYRKHWYDEDGTKHEMDKI